MGRVCHCLCLMRYTPWSRVHENVSNIQRLMCSYGMYHISGNLQTAASGSNNIGREKGFATVTYFPTHWNGAMKMALTQCRLWYLFLDSMNESCDTAATRFPPSDTFFLSEKNILWKQSFCKRWWVTIRRKDMSKECWWFPLVSEMYENLRIFVF